jgi:hypothetical protein
MATRAPPRPTTRDALGAMIHHGVAETQRDLDKRVGGPDERQDGRKGVLKDVGQELNATQQDVRLSTRRCTCSSARRLCSMPPLKKPPALASPALRAKPG